MTTAAYLAQTALEYLDQAQDMIVRHLVGCPLCSGNRPCDERLAAEQLFLRYGCLPKRQPGVLGRHVFGIGA